MSPELFGKVAHLLINEFLLKQVLFLVVESFFEDLDLGLEGLLVRVFTAKVSPMRVLSRVL